MMSASAIRDTANARQHEMDNMRAHRRRHVKNAERRRTGGDSRERVEAKLLTNCGASELQRPLVSSSTTIKGHPTWIPQRLEGLAILLSVRPASKGNVELRDCTFGNRSVFYARVREGNHEDLMLDPLE